MIPLLGNVTNGRCSVVFATPSGRGPFATVTRQEFGYALRSVVWRSSTELSRAQMRPPGSVEKKVRDLGSRVTAKAIRCGDAVTYEVAVDNPGCNFFTAIGAQFSSGCHFGTQIAA